MAGEQVRETAAAIAKPVRRSLARRVGGILQDLYRSPRDFWRWGSVIAAMLRRPRDAARWVRERLRAQSTLETGLPWLSWACVDYLRGFLKPGMEVFEYGGGGSTIFFAGHGCKVTTVEGYADWVQTIEAKLQELNLEAEIRHVDLQDDDRVVRSRYVRQVHDGGPWDLVLVDGTFRLECLAEARTELKPGGLLLLDNANWDEFREVPQLLNGFERIALRGLGVARRWVTQTDVYSAPGA